MNGETATANQQPPAPLPTRIAQSRYGAILLVMVAALVTGWLLAGDYGRSVDEHTDILYGWHTLDSYRGLNDPSEPYRPGLRMQNHGPFYNMVFALSPSAWRAVRPGWSKEAARHFTNYLTFLGGVLALYALCLRFSSLGAALAATLLFMTQPVLFGHAYINQKDIPFMAFFLAAVAAGFAMADSLTAPDGQAASKSYGWLVAGGVLLGLSTSIRVAGPLAGVLVSGYLLFRARGRALAPLAVYWLIAALACYATWPYLWHDPLGHLWESISTMSDFRAGGVAMFQGTYYVTPPRGFVPFMLLVQLTEAVLPLALVGLVSAIWQARQPEGKPAALGLVAAWLGLPLLGVVVLGTRVYDNFRHLLFALPPLFVLAGMGLDTLFNWLKKTSLKVAASAALLAPGVIAIILLHPYEYVYYNTLVGGVRGAEGQYALDYWCTSLHEAVAYTNEVASPNAEIAVAGPIPVAGPYARPDLTLTGGLVVADWDVTDPEYAVICGRGDSSLSDAPVVYRVMQRGVTLSEVRRLR